MATKMKKTLLGLVFLGAFSASSLDAASVALTLGIRETGGSGPIFSNAGTAGGIEWVNLDGQSLALDGTWQLFSFTPAADTLNAFAGTTANAVLEVSWASIEHIRILNSEGLTAPIRLWIDDISNTGTGSSLTEGFEGFGVGDEVMFQEPNFSGSTAGNLLLGGTSAVSDSAAFSGLQSYEFNFQFVDGDPSGWVRLTTFNAPELPNPAVLVAEPGTPSDPTIAFYARGVVIPEPSTTAALLIMAVAAAVPLWKRHRK